MKKILSSLFIATLFSLSASASNTKFESPKEVKQSQEIIKKSMESSKFEIKSVKVGNKYFYTITLMCTTLVFFEYTSALGVLQDLIAHSPGPIMAELNFYFCGSYYA